MDASGAEENSREEKAWYLKVGRYKQQSEMEDEADADLKIILRAGIEHGADVVAFGAQGDARDEFPIDATASLESETVFAARRGLRIDVSAADESVSPGRPAMGCGAPTDAGAAGVEHVLGTSGENVATPGGDDVAFETKPVSKVVGDIGVEAAEARGKRSGLEVDILVTGGEFPAVKIVVLVAALRGRGRIRERGGGKEGGSGGWGRKRGNKIEIGSDGCGRR